jgi:hypothetical protein
MLFIKKKLLVQESIRKHGLDFIALLKTGRSNSSVTFLRHLAAGMDFAWFCLPSHGRSAGIFMDIINIETLQVKTVDVGDYFVKLKTR